MTGVMSLFREFVGILEYYSERPDRAGVFEVRACTEWFSTERLRLGL